MSAAERYHYSGTSDNNFILISKAEVFFFNQADEYISETPGKDFLLFTVVFCRVYISSLQSTISATPLPWGTIGNTLFSLPTITSSR